MKKKGGVRALKVCEKGPVDEFYFNDQYSLQVVLPLINNSSKKVNLCSIINLLCIILVFNVFKKTIIYFYSIFA